MIQSTKTSKKREYSSSLPYIIIAGIVFGLSLLGAYFLWRFTVANLQYFTAEKLSIFVLVSGVIGSIILFRALYMFAVSRDEEVKRREAIQNQLNTTVLSNIGDGVLATDIEGKIIFINNAMRSMILENGNLDNKKVSEILSIEDENGKKISVAQSPIAKAIKSKKRLSTTVVKPEYYFVRSDKTRFPGMVTASPVKSGGNIAGAVLVVRDVTQDKEVDTAKSEFVSLASHQLRTPLSTMLWYVEALLKQRAGKITEEQSKYLRTVYDGGERMTELVNALLNVSRIELGTFAVDPKPVDLKAQAEDVLAELKPTIGEKGMKIEKNYDKTLGKISADPNLTRIIFQNLLSNAVKYTPPEGNISIVIGKEGSNVLISVSDTGYGIPQNDQNKIFSKLFRAKNVSETEIGGNGLGLYIVKSILDHSGGRIWFESPAVKGKVENPGTTFHVTLPLSGMKKREGSRKLN
jgi:signal transduction histidine kinase